MKLTQRLLVYGIAGAILALPSPAAAQQRVGGSGLFQKRPDPTTGQRLDFTVSSAEGYDADDNREGAVPIRPNPEPTGYSTLLSATGDYAWLGRRAQLRAVGTSQVRYFGSIQNLTQSSDQTLNHSGVISLSARAKSTTFAANQTVTYSSSALYNFFASDTTPGAAPIAPQDYRFNDQELLAYGSTVVVRHEFNRKTSLVTTVNRAESNTLGRPEGTQRLISYGLRNQLSRRISRNVSFVGEYFYGIGDIGAGIAIPGRMVAEHRAEFGADWKRVLSATRQLEFSGRVGASASVLPDLVAGEAIDRRYEQLSGQVMLGYQLTRSWKVRGTYRRGVEYIAGLAQPVFADSVTGNLDGLISRRVDITASGGYSSGDSVLSRGAPVFNTYTGTTRLRYAATRSLAAYVEYVYYFYNFQGIALLAPGVPRGLERHSARIGFILIVPGFRS